MKKKIIFPINSKIYSGLESVAITIIENLKDKFDFIYYTRWTYSRYTKGKEN